MAKIVYLLCAATSATCAFLLIRSYLRSRTALLLWSSLSFLGLTANSALLVVDLLVIPDISLAVARSVVALVAMCTLLFGLIWNVR